MSWRVILRWIADEADQAAADRIAARARRELAPVKIYIGTRDPINETVAAAADDGNVKHIAKAIGVHPSTVYRKLRQRLIR